MKAKRLLAVMLSVAMVATSGDFVSAAEAVNAAGTPFIDSFEEAYMPDAVTGDVAAQILGTTDDPGDKTRPTNDGEDKRKQVIPVDSEYFALNGYKELIWKEGVNADSLKKGSTVDLPKEAEIIPAGIFSNNPNITGLNIPADSALVTIETGAFEKSGVKELKLPAAVTTIKAETFKDSDLQTITFADDAKLTVIGKEAFFGSDLTTITLPNSVTVLETSAFRACTSLTKVDLRNVQTIGADAFNGCTTLDENGIGWSQAIREIGASAFAGTKVSELSFAKADNAWVKNVVWGGNVFKNCKSLTKVSFPDDFTVIPAGMFVDCTALATISFPKNCVVIEDGAFENCTALKTITIPENVKRIGAKAFGGCSGLTTVTIKQKGSGASGESDIVIVQNAFPKKTMTMKGYDGTVEDYADLMGYTFKTLFEAHAITVEKGSHGSVSLSKKSARAGVVIEVTVKPDDGYRVKATTFTFNDQRIDDLKKADETSQVFTFEMPDDDVLLNVDFEKDGDYGELYVSFEKTDEQIACDYSKSNKRLTMDKVGYSCKLVVKGKSYTPGIWVLNFSSDNTKVATIDSKGVIYAKGVGTATITATLTTGNKDSVKFKVKVTEAAEPEHFSLVYSGLGKGKRTTETIAGKDYTVITYTKANVAKEERSFSVNIVATENNSSVNLMLPSTWTVSNTDLGYIAEGADTVYDNSNTIHVKKGVIGETAVTVEVTNGLSDKKKVTYYEESIIVRIIDSTPRLEQSKLTVNALSTMGTEFDLISVYGYEVVPSGITVVKTKTTKGVTDYENVSYVTVKYTGGKHYLMLTDEGLEYVRKKNGTVTLTDVYFEGDYTYATDNGIATETFHTAIPSLVLTNKALKPSVKLSGKINLFYNQYADAQDSGTVKVTQNLTTLDVTGYELVSTANYAKEGSEETDSFANNYKITPNGEIFRSDKEAILDANGKVISSGYLKIYYAGYDPCYVKITIPTKTVKPAYVLSATKATINSLNTGFPVQVKLLEKKSKKQVDLGSLNLLSFDESAKGITFNLFEDPDIEAAKATDVIEMRVKSPQKGKVVLNVKMAAWSEPMKFTFNLKVLSKLPTVKFKPSTLTLNNQCEGQTAMTTLKCSQSDVQIVEFRDWQFIGRSSLAADASRIQFKYDNGVLYAHADQELSTGSYKFRVTPVASYVNGTTGALKSCTVTVKVIQKKLTATLKPKTVTLNNLFAGQENVKIHYTIKNMPLGSGITVISDKVSVIGANAKSQQERSAFEFTFDGDDTYMSVKQTSLVRKAASYKYKISGLQIETAGGEKAEIQPFAVTVKVISKQVKLNAKATGSLNISNSNSYLLYKLTTVNSKAPIRSVVVTELNTATGKYEAATNFKIGGYTDADGNTYDGDDTRDGNDTGDGIDKGICGVKIQAADNVQLDAKKNYKIRFEAVLVNSSGGTNRVLSSPVTIKPVQTLPKIATDVKDATMYAGASIASGKRTKEVLITKTTEKESVISSVAVSKNNAKNVRNAFTVTFDQATQKASITLIRPDLLKPNTEYAVNFEVRTYGQLENTTGPEFTLNIKVHN